MDENISDEQMIKHVEECTKKVKDLLEKSIKK